MYPEDKAEDTWIHNGIRCVVVLTDLGHRCGYAITEIPLPEEVRERISVHGGITYYDARTDRISYTFVYGFDCAHFGDYNSCVTPNGKKWTKDEAIIETNKMADNILAASEYMKAWDAIEEAKDAILTLINQNQQ